MKKRKKSQIVVAHIIVWAVLIIIIGTMLYAFFASIYMLGYMGCMRDTLPIMFEEALNQINQP